MTRLTAIEIATNYPDNLLIIGRQEKNRKWTSLLYMTREDQIHKLMLSYDICDEFQGWDTENDAINNMKELVDAVVKTVNNGNF